MINKDAGVAMKAADALAHQEVFGRAQMAYLVALAYHTGYRHGAHDWYYDYDPVDPVMGTHAEVRAGRKAQRLAEYERTAGPARYQGGPVEW